MHTSSRTCARHLRRCRRHRSSGGVLEAFLLGRGSGTTDRPQQPMPALDVRLDGEGRGGGDKWKDWTRRMRRMARKKKAALTLRKDHEEGLAPASSQFSVKRRAPKTKKEMLAFKVLTVRPRSAMAVSRPFFSSSSSRGTSSPSMRA